jgi:hypothetical protein
MIHEQDLKQAAAFIVKAERDLGRLSAGQQRDLLKDNTDWPAVDCDKIVDVLNMTWGVGAYHLAEARLNPVKTETRIPRGDFLAKEISNDR